jgi:hypothetical protein
VAPHSDAVYRRDLSGTSKTTHGSDAHVLMHLTGAASGAGNAKMHLRDSIYTAPGSTTKPRTAQRPGSEENHTNTCLSPKP